MKEKIYLSTVLLAIMLISVLKIWELNAHIFEQSELIVQQRLLITEYQKNCDKAMDRLKFEELETIQGICGNSPQ